MVKGIVIAALAIAALMATAYFLTTGTGKPISSDLSVIAQGKPVLVLVYENYSPTGGEALNRLRTIRTDYDSRLEFAVADVGTPEGSAFANRYQLRDGLAAFIKNDGQLLEITDIPLAEQALRDKLNAMLEADGGGE